MQAESAVLEIDDAPLRVGQGVWPAERLLSLLRLIERTVLPRHIELASMNTIMTLPVAGQRLQLGARVQNQFVIDDTLAKAAPAAHKLIRRRSRAISRRQDVLEAHQTELCACAARALLAFCAEGEAAYQTDAASREEIGAPVAFSAMELYERARDQVANVQYGPVRKFVDSVRPKMAEIWVVTQDGWILEGPTARRTPDVYAAMTRTTLQLSAWTAATTRETQPAIAYATRPPYDWIWCIVSDAAHFALLRCPPPHWAATLSAWNHDVPDAPSAPAPWDG